jgi:hypothetical protein
MTSGAEKPNALKLPLAHVNRSSNPIENLLIRRDHTSCIVAEEFNGMFCLVDFVKLLIYNVPRGIAAADVFDLVPDSPSRLTGNG